MMNSSVSEFPHLTTFTSQTTFPNGSLWSFRPQSNVTCSFSMNHNMPEKMKMTVSNKHGHKTFWMSNTLKHGFANLFMRKQMHSACLLSSRIHKVFGGNKTTPEGLPSLVVIYFEVSRKVNILVHNKNKCTFVIMVTDLAFNGKSEC